MPRPVFSILSPADSITASGDEDHTSISRYFNIIMLVKYKETQKR